LNAKLRGLDFVLKTREEALRGSKLDPDGRVVVLLED
jgi:hypothetical protein